VEISELFMLRERQLLLSLSVQVHVMLFQPLGLMQGFHKYLIFC